MLYCSSLSFDIHNKVRKMKFQMSLCLVTLICFDMTGSRHLLFVGPDIVMRIMFISKDS